MKVLIADDEKIECVALEKMLKELFPEIFFLPSVYNGLEMIRMVEAQTPDILIVDINMPLLNGLEALEALRAKNYKMEIIIHTAYSEFEYLHKAMQLGAYEFLVKPVEYSGQFYTAIPEVGNRHSDIKETVIPL